MKTREEMADCMECGVKIKCSNCGHGVAEAERAKPLVDALEMWVGWEDNKKPIYKSFNYAQCLDLARQALEQSKGRWE